MAADSNPDEHRSSAPHSSPTAWVIAALIAGIAGGILIDAVHDPQASAMAAALAPIGTLWVNAILATVIPLVVSSLVVGVATPENAASLGRSGVWAIALFAMGVTVTAIVSAAAFPALYGRLTIDPAIAATLRADASLGEAAHVPGSVGEWLVSLVPSNAIRSAADGAMLPLVIFTLAFALALSRVAPEVQRPVLSVFRGVAAAMRVLVEWVMVLAPVGVFCLVLPLVARLGGAAVGAIGYYFGASALVASALTLCVYPVVVLAGGVPLRRFARAVAPAQAYAFGARSSLASLPALIDGGERGLGLPVTITSFVLPLAVATFKFAAPTVSVGGAFFLARLYGIDIEPARVASMVALGALMTFASPGVPGGGVIAGAPVLIAAGLPVQGLGILLALDTIPDMFRAPANVTADLACATIIARRLGAVEATAPAMTAPTVT